MKEFTFAVTNVCIITADEFRELGLDKNLADRIIKYKVKGGQFHQSTDLLKIYGMDSSWYMRAEPFVKIEKEEKRACSLIV